jgi:hypothetical protein
MFSTDVWLASLRARRVPAAPLNDVFARMQVISKVPAMVLGAPSDALRWCADLLSYNLPGVS